MQMLFGKNSIKTMCWYAYVRRKYSYGNSIRAEFFSFVIVECTHEKFVLARINPIDKTFKQWEAGSPNVTGW